MDLQGAMRTVDEEARDRLRLDGSAAREDRVGGAGALFPTAFASALRAVAANPAEAEIDRLAAEKAQEVAAAIEHARACHALAAAISATAEAKKRGGGDLTTWTDADAAKVYAIAAEIKKAEETAIFRAA
jgi:hypothetical protein